MLVSGEINKQTVSIAAGTKYSSAFRAAGNVRGSLQMDDAITSASFSIQVSNEDTPTHWTDLQDDAGSAISVVPCVASESCPLPSQAFQYLYARIKTASNEAADRSLRIVLVG